VSIAQLGLPSWQRCPRCGSDNPIDRGYSAWCDQCGWNLNPHADCPQDGALAGARKQFEAFFGKRLLAQELKSPSGRRITVSGLLAVAVALATDALILVMTVLGGLMIVLGFPAWAIPGFVLVLTAWSMRPRFSKMPQAGLTRAQAPRLYASLDQVSRALGAADVDLVVPTEAFQASLEQRGLLGRRRVLIVGLPLWSILAPEERLALLAHELAHGANGDPMRTWLVGGAVDSWVEVHDLLIPDYVVKPVSRATRQTRTQARWNTIAVFEIPMRIVMALLANAFLGFAWLLLLLVFRDSQRAEYAADLAGARISGTRAFVSMLGKLEYGPAYRRTLEGAAAGSGKTGAFARFSSGVEATPAREKDRLSRLSRLEAHRLQASHPAQGCRIKVLEAHPVEASLQPSLTEAIDFDLRPWMPALEARAVAAAEDRLYF
jgi:Zn-dependent protease with chaperone function